MKGYYRYPIGSFACTNLLDGEKEYAPRELFCNASEEELRSVMHQQGSRGSNITLTFTHLFVDTGDHQILIDTGAGKLFPNSGHLLDNMLAAEIEPSEIDTVIITHAHPDHVGGIFSAEGELLFPRATYLIAKLEWDYWFSNEAGGKGAEYDWFVECARKRLEPIRDRVRFVHFTNEKAEVYPGVSVWRTPGHTPGHVVVDLESSGTGLFYIADLALTPLHLEHPSWRPIFDIEPERAAVAKRFIFDLAADRDYWIVGQHFSPFPSLGHVTHRGSGWTWRPVEADGPHDR